MTSDVQSMARARLTEGTFTGEAKVKFAQTIVGTEGACLSVLAADSEERLAGRFAYVAVDSSATCDSLEREGWLDRALAEAGS